jgi:hypothetical protein
MCQEEKYAKNNFKPGFLMKQISELSHFRTAIFQNGTKTFAQLEFTPQLFSKEAFNLCF